MNDDDGGVSFPEIAVAARRCNLDAEALAESALASYEAGFPRRQAVAMNIVEMLRRRGAYHGKLKAAVDSGVIFQMAYDDDERGARPMTRAKQPKRSTELAEAHRRLQDANYRWFLADFQRDPKAHGLYEAVQRCRDEVAKLERREEATK